MAEVSDRKRRLIEMMSNSEKELHSRDEEFYTLLTEKEKELKATTQQLKQEFLVRERKLLFELKERESLFAAREQELQRRSVDIERRAAEYEAALNDLRSRSIAEQKIYEEQYEKTLSELSKEREQYKAEIQLRIEGKSSEYVNDAIEALKTNERIFYWTSFSWSVLGGLGIVLGLGFLLYSLHEGAQEVIANKEIGWMLICFLATKSMVVLGVAFALAKYAMMFSKSYMHESLRNIERQHAINFGKFYLGTYGAGASWDSVKSVFEHWNISRDSAFLSSDKDKPQDLITSTNTAEAISGTGRKIFEKEE